MSLQNNYIGNIYSMSDSDLINIKRQNFNNNDPPGYPPYEKLIQQMGKMMRKIMQEELVPIKNDLNILKKKTESIENKQDILIKNQKIQDNNIQKIMNVLKEINK